MSVSTPVDFKAEWAPLQGTFASILSAEPNLRLSGIAAFQTIFKLIIYNSYEKKLWEALCELFVSHCNKVRKKILEEDEVVAPYVMYYTRYGTSLFFINSLCRTLNDRHTPKNEEPCHKYCTPDPDKNDMPVQMMAMQIWRVHVVEEISNSSNKVVYQVIQAMDKYREGDVIDLSLLRTVVLSYSTNYGPQHNASTYELFEKPLLARSQEYYQKDAQNLIEKHNVSEFIRMCDHRIEKERNLCISVCPETETAVLQIMFNEFLVKSKEKLQEEAQKFLQDESYEDFALLYKMLKKINAENYLLNLLEGYVYKLAQDEIAKQDLSDPKFPAQYVTTLYKIYEQFMHVARDLIRDSQTTGECITAIEKAFRSILTASDNIKPAEVLARYSELILKKSKEVVNDISHQQHDILLQLFKYLDGKDIFQKFYEKFFARRLMQKTFASEELEEYMITQLKAICGTDFTFRMQRMFNDHQLTQEYGEKFKRYCEDRKDKIPNSKIEFNVSVLTASSWPLSQKDMSFRLPEELQPLVPLYEEFFKYTYTGRKLFWLYNISNVDLRLNGFVKAYELTMTTFQAAILLSFNNSTKLSVPELMEHTSLDESYLIKSLKPFRDMRLLKSTDEELTTKSVLELNPKFSAKSIKIKVAYVNLDNSEESTTIQGQVEEDRKIYLQAVIVRLMKTNKKLKHSQLVEQVIRNSSSRFQPSIPSIKKCIEILIEKKYMDRSDNQHDEYFYLA